MKYKKKSSFSIKVGFDVKTAHINKAIIETNKILIGLPSTLYKCIDFKTTSAIIGAIFCDTTARITGSIVNPIEKGHPDIIPKSGQGATEEELRAYPQGLEIKCTVGNIQQGANLRAGETRIDKLTGITWQAHHRKVGELLGLVWDFVEDGHGFNYPTITGAFYSSLLVEDDWGVISGTTGRNTKVTGMRASGKEKMGNGWVCILDDDKYLKAFKKKLKFSI